MTDNMPTTFFTEERLGLMWDYTAWFLEFNMPLIMIGLAILVAIGVISVILYIFDVLNPASKVHDDDDYEVRHY